MQSIISWVGDCSGENGRPVCGLCRCT